MEKVRKVVLLSDDDTSQAGILFLDALEGILRERGITVWHQRILVRSDVMEAVHQFDRIPLELKPDLLIVADFACIKMQSEQEEPFYNNFEMPVIHLLFRRPWEYEVFMVWRCNFTTRYYCMLEEDAELIQEYYPQLLNVSCLEAEIWNLDARAVCYMNGLPYEELLRQCDGLPEYLKTIRTCWQMEKEKQKDCPDARAMRLCLDRIGFACNKKEFLDIMYLMQPVFAVNYLEQNGIPQEGTAVDKHAGAFEAQVDEFLQLDFKISLL